ncbi:hypothetical protein PENTCL1PPCAC_84, partial [Pristionchus entomophagus]
LSFFFLSQLIPAMILRRSLVVLLVIFSAASAEYTYFADHKGVGIRDADGTTCLYLSFLLQMRNYNLGEGAPLENIDLGDSVLGGRCGTRNDEDDSAYLSAKFTHVNRTRTFLFNFKQATIVVDRYEQARWSLFQISYAEAYEGQQVVFLSPNGSVVSGPLKQQFTCRDTINTTLTHEIYQPIDVFLAAPVEIQPYGLSSNIYLCERTRRRSLSESFEAKSTVASGIVLLLSSIGVIVGHTLRRHFIPERKAAYDNLG